MNNDKTRHDKKRLQKLVLQVDALLTFLFILRCKKHIQQISRYSDVTKTNSILIELSRFKKNTASSLAIPTD